MSHRCSFFFFLSFQPPPINLSHSGARSLVRMFILYLIHALSIYCAIDQSLQQSSNHLHSSTNSFSHMGCCLEPILRCLLSPPLLRSCHSSPASLHIPRLLPRCPRALAHIRRTHAPANGTDGIRPPPQASKTTTSVKSRPEMLSSNAILHRPLPCCSLTRLPFFSDLNSPGSPT